MHQGFERDTRSDNYMPREAWMDGELMLKWIDGVQNRNCQCNCLGVVQRTPYRCCDGERNSARTQYVLSSSLVVAHQFCNHWKPAFRGNHEMALAEKCILDNAKAERRRPNPSIMLKCWHPWNYCGMARTSQRRWCCEAGHGATKMNLFVMMS